MYFSLKPEPMNFTELHERLRHETLRRIDQGVISVSLLARHSGLAQTHVSNFLHQRRHLSLPALDRLLLAQTLSVEDLFPATASILSSPEGTARNSMDTVPIVSQNTAITAPLISPGAMQDRLYLPSGWLATLPLRRAANNSRRNWDRFVAVRTTAVQAQAMEPVLHIGSVAVLDRHYNSVTAWNSAHRNIYGIHIGFRMVFGYASFESGCLIVRPYSFEHPLELIEMTAEKSPADFVTGRLCLCISEL